MEQNIETYYVDFGTAKAWFTLRGDSQCTTAAGTHTIPRQRLLDFIATAQALGLNAGRT